MVINYLYQIRANYCFITSLSSKDTWSTRRRFSRRECSRSESARSKRWRNDIISAFRRDDSTFVCRSERSSCRRSVVTSCSRDCFSAFTWAMSDRSEAEMRVSFNFFYNAVYLKCLYIILKKSRGRGGQGEAICLSCFQRSRSEFVYQHL